MGTLKPGATYIYESENGRVYAREFGSTERKIIGWAASYQNTADTQYYMNEMNNVLAMCENDPAMKDLLEQLFVLYNLKKKHDDIMWHPV